MLKDGKTKIEISDVFLEYNSTIYSYIYSRVNYSKVLAEDLTQDVFVKCLTNIKKFNDEKGTIKTWLFTIAHNIIVDFYRTNNKHISDVNEEIVEIIAEANEDKENDKELLLKQIRNKLVLLSDKDRELITLRYINEISLQEMSVILKFDYHNLKVAVNRALQKLKKLIEQT
jgi:RNA polymerase sigma-70 factor (ECF subfamily)